MIKMMITCVATFTLCWLPLNIFVVIGDNYSSIYDYENIEYVWFACHWLAMSHASYNPVTYIWMNARFRYGFSMVMHKLCPCLDWLEQNRTATVSENGNLPSSNRNQTFGDGRMRANAAGAAFLKANGDVSVAENNGNVIQCAVGKSKVNSKNGSVKQDKHLEKPLKRSKQDFNFNSNWKPISLYSFNSRHSSSSTPNNSLCNNYCDQSSQHHPETLIAECKPNHLTMASPPETMKIRKPTKNGLSDQSAGREAGNECPERCHEETMVSMDNGNHPFIYTTSTECEHKPSITKCSRSSKKRRAEK